jgi:serine protease Do
MAQPCRRLGLAVTLLSSLFFTSSLRAQAHSPASETAGHSVIKPNTAERTALIQFSDQLAGLVDRVSPAVVQVLVDGYGPVGSGGTSVVARQSSMGSGIIVDPDGYILTNAHVVENAQRVRVVLITRSASLEKGFPSVKRSIFEANILGVHHETDLALLKIKATGLPSIPLPENRKVREGELVVAVGSPQGLENSVSMGIVSAVERQPDPERVMIFIQTDAPINPGNSGGPLVNVRGELVGINTFILSQSGGSEGLGFAVPASMARFIYGQLRQYGRVHRSVVGAQAQTITPLLAKALNLSQDWGIIISDVYPGGPAEAAGLKVGDIVQSLDGRPIDMLGRFQAGLFLHRTDQNLQLEVLRGGKQVQLGIPVIEEKTEIDPLSALVDPEKNRIPRLGLLGIDIGQQTAELLPRLRINSGVAIVAKTAGYRTEDTGLLPGDVIHFVNGNPVANMQDLGNQLKALKAGDPVVLQIEREGELSYLPFEME